MQNENKFIKIIDKNFADILCSNGFTYALEQNDKQTIYVFPFDSKLCELIKSTMGVAYGEGGQIVCESTLRF